MERTLKKMTTKGEAKGRGRANWRWSCKRRIRKQGWRRGHKEVGGDVGEEDQDVGQIKST
jgi:hypothetical protein